MDIKQEIQAIRLVVTTAENKRILFVLSDQKNRYEQAVYSYFLKHLGSFFAIDGHSYAPEVDVMDLSTQQHATNIPITAAAGSRYDLVITHGSWVTRQKESEKLFLKNTENREYPDDIPHFFLGVDDELYYSLRQRDLLSARIAGITRMPASCDQALLQAFTLRNDIKRIVLPYDQYSLTDGEDFGKYGVRGSMQRFFEKRGIRIDSLPLHHNRDLTKHDIDMIRSSDMVCMSQEASVTSKLEQLAYYCNDYNTVLFGSDLRSVLEGAAVGYGSTGEDHGLMGARMVFEWFTNPFAVRMNPIRTVVESGEGRFNPNTIYQQMPNLSPEHSLLLHMRSIMKNE